MRYFAQAMHDTPHAPDTTDAAAAVFDVTTDEFQAKVLDASHKVPVVVDFWAAWCAPCRMLGPVLERAVTERAGKVLLAKVDTDRDQALAARFRIQGIPAVKAFYRGRVVNEFVGARDARFIGTFLDGLVPSEAAQAISDARAHLEARRPAEAAAALEPHVQGATGDEKTHAQALLAEAYVGLGGDKLAAAQALLSSLDPRGPALVLERAELLAQVIEFFTAADATAAPTTAEGRYTLAAALAQSLDQADRERAFELLLEVVASDRKLRDDGAKRALLALFQYLGPGDDLVHEYRRRLQVVL